MLATIASNLRILRREQNHAAAITHYDAALALARDAGQGHHEALEAVLLANRAACLFASHILATCSARVAAAFRGSHKRAR